MMLRDPQQADDVGLSSDTGCTMYLAGNPLYSFRFRPFAVELSKQTRESLDRIGRTNDVLEEEKETEMHRRLDRRDSFP